MLFTAAGAALGAVVFYTAGAYVLCEWIYPGSNLCGLPAVFVAALLGVLAGGAGGWFLGRRGKGG